MKKSGKVIFTLFLFLFLPFVVNAASKGELKLEGNVEVLTESYFTLDITARNITGSNLMGVGGKVISSDSNCFDLVSIEMVLSGTSNKSKFAYLDADGFGSDGVIAKATFQSNSSVCSAEVQITEPKLAFTDGTRLNAEVSKKMISVKELVEVEEIKNTVVTLNEVEEMPKEVEKEEILVVEKDEETEEVVQNETKKNETISVKQEEKSSKQDDAISYKQDEKKNSNVLSGHDEIISFSRVSEDDKKINDDFSKVELLSNKNDMLLSSSLLENQTLTKEQNGMNLFGISAIVVFVVGIGSFGIVKFLKKKNSLK